ncbi:MULTISPECIES: hypothetical protein [Clostridium]|uniref:hypothetical protein n=1 Tax=Clostridium TaxID=1485 RepID=UPI0008242006|nr:MULTISPECIES: hypothetical protein [Clostridium]
MDKEYEIDIVRAFFNKHCQERISYELASKNKRYNAIGRLCHDFQEVLKLNYMIKIECLDYKDVLKEMKYYGALKTCYVISYNKIVDGMCVKLDEALKNVVGYGMPSLVVCVPNKLAYFESEQLEGAPPRYILQK